MDKKLKVLYKLANLLNTHKIKWNVGASCMLYLRGLVPSFNDIDIMIQEKDVTKLKKLLEQYPLEIRKPNDKYQTKFFLEYIIDGVEIDIMAGFSIVKNGQVHYFPMHQADQFDRREVDGVVVYMESLEQWYQFYYLMDRTDKVLLLQDHIDKNQEEKIDEV
jgi:hypothetical protein